MKLTVHEIRHFWHVLNYFSVDDCSFVLIIFMLYILQEASDSLSSWLSGVETGQTIPTERCELYSSSWSAVLMMVSYDIHWTTTSDGQYIQLACLHEHKYCQTHSCSTSSSQHLELLWTQILNMKSEEWKVTCLTYQWMYQVTNFLSLPHRSPL